MDFLINCYYNIKDFIFEWTKNFVINTKEILLDDNSKDNIINYFSNYWGFYLILIVLLYLLFNNNNGLSRMSKETLKFGGLAAKTKKSNKKELEAKDTKNEKDYRL